MWQGGEEGRTYIYRCPVLRCFQLFYVHQVAARNDSFIAWEYMGVVKESHQAVNAKTSRMPSSAGKMGVVKVASGSECEDIQLAFVG
jgi:hypothetical protein